MTDSHSWYYQSPWQLPMIFILPQQLSQPSYFWNQVPDLPWPFTWSHNKVTFDPRKWHVGVTGRSNSLRSARDMYEGALLCLYWLFVLFDLIVSAEQNFSGSWNPVEQLFYLFLLSSWTANRFYFLDHALRMMKHSTLSNEDWVKMAILKKILGGAMKAEKVLCFSFISTDTGTTAIPTPQKPG